MKKRILFLTAVLSGLLAFPVFAEQMVGRVQIDISPSEDVELASGETYFKPEAVALDSGYEVSGFSVDGKQNSVKKPYTYTISVKPESGHAVRMRWQLWRKVRTASRLRQMPIPSMF